MKTFSGNVISIKMAKTAVIGVMSQTKHPLYNKILKKINKFKADTNGIEISVGDKVKIVETRPISKTKYYKVIKVIK